jgi:hypothetical protein
MPTLATRTAPSAQSCCPGRSTVTWSSVRPWGHLSEGGQSCRADHGGLADGELLGEHVGAVQQQLEGLAGRRGLDLAHAPQPRARHQPSHGRRRPAVRFGSGASAYTAMTVRTPPQHGDSAKFHRVGPFAGRVLGVSTAVSSADAAGLFSGKAGRSRDGATGGTSPGPAQAGSRCWPCPVQGLRGPVESCAGETLQLSVDDHGPDPMPRQGPGPFVADTCVWGDLLYAVRRCQHGKVSAPGLKCRGHGRRMRG